jgi:cytochrome c oxidase assembly factor 5
MSEKEANENEKKVAPPNLSELDEIDTSDTPIRPKHKCDGLRYDLKMCLLKSDCVQVYRQLPRKCLQDPEMLPHVPDRCWSLANTFFECKRSLIDMRYRFRGPKGY